MGGAGGLLEGSLADNVTFIGSYRRSYLDIISDAINAGSYKNALEYVIIAQKLEPLNPDVYRMKALLHESLGDPKKAIISWEKCILYSNNKDIKSFHKYPEKANKIGIFACCNYTTLN